MFEKLTGQLKLKKIQNQNCVVSSPIEQLKQSRNKNLLKSMSEYALNLYQRRTEVKNFTKLALSNPDDLSHNELIKEKELDEYDILFDLSNNDEFLKDLGL